MDLNKILKFYLIADRKICGEDNLLNTISEAKRAGITAVQYRDKSTFSIDKIKICKEIKNILSFSSVPLIINDDVNLALETDADGIHIGQNDMSMVDVYSLKKSEQILGFSYDTANPKIKAEKEFVDYIGVGPIFQTSSKLDNIDIIGLNALKKICSNEKIPCVAIGGINKNNCNEVLKTGVSGIAVISAICGKPNPFQEASELSKIIDRFKF